MTARKHRGLAVPSLLSAVFAIGATAASCSIDTDSRVGETKGPDASAPLAIAPQLESASSEVVRGGGALRQATIRLADLPREDPRALPQAVPYFPMPMRGVQNESAAS